MQDEWDMCRDAYSGDPNALLPWMMMVLSTHNYLVGLLKSRGLPDDMLYRGVEEAIATAYLKTSDSHANHRTPRPGHRKKWFWRKAVKAAERWLKKNQLFLPPAPPPPPAIHLTNEQEATLNRDADLVRSRFDLLFRGSEDGLFLEYAIDQGLGAEKAGEKFGMSKEEAEVYFEKLISRLADCIDEHPPTSYGALTEPDNE